MCNLSPVTDTNCEGNQTSTDNLSCHWPDMKTKRKKYTVPQISKIIFRKSSPCDYYLEDMTESSVALNSSISFSNFIFSDFLQWISMSKAA